MVTGEILLRDRVVYASEDIWLKRLSMENNGKHLSQQITQSTPTVLYDFRHLLLRIVRLICIPYTDNSSFRDRIFLCHLKHRNL